MTDFSFFSKPVRASVSVLGVVISLFASELSFAQGSNSNSSDVLMCRLTPVRSAAPESPIEVEAFNMCDGQGTIEPINRSWGGLQFVFEGGNFSISLRNENPQGANSFQLLRSIQASRVTQVAVLTPGNQFGVLVRCFQGRRSSCGTPADRRHYRPQRAPSPVERH